MVSKEDRAQDKKQNQSEKQVQESSKTVPEIHPNDKTGMAARTESSDYDKHVKADDAPSSQDRSKGSRTEKTSDDVAFESSREAEKGFMDKSRIEEKPKGEE